MWSVRISSVALGKQLIISRRRRCVSSLSGADLATFESLLGKSHVITDPDLVEGFNRDWTGEFKGSSKLVLLPSSTEQVSQVLKYCFDKQLALVPQGGNTGLVGGSVPIRDEIILSLKHLNKIHEFDQRIGAITCDAGVVLQQADDYVRERGCLMPLDLGSKGSCQVGGNLATNAGGIRLIKYGSLRGNVLGLQVVLSDGSIIDRMGPLRKDNVGYDLKQLFVGSEGTLRIITKCCLLTPTRPRSSIVALLAIQSFDDALRALVRCKEELTSDLSAFEYLDKNSSLLVQEYEKLKNPLHASNAPFFVVVEANGADESDLKTRLENILEKLVEEGIVSDALISDSERQYGEIWGLRERITSSLRSSGMRVFKYDISLPVVLLHQATKYVSDKLAQEGMKDVRVFEYGHLGDGNLHFNATCPNKAPDHVAFVQSRIEEHLYNFVKEHRGSISAEHGLGQLKAKKILYSRSLTEVQWMRTIKQAFDPKGILNPGKVLVSVI